MLTFPSKERLIEMYHKGIVDTEENIRLYRYMFIPKDGVWRLHKSVTEKELLEMPTLAKYTFVGDWEPEKMTWALNIIENR